MLQHVQGPIANIHCNRLDRLSLSWFGTSVLSVCTKFALPGLWLGVPNQILYNILLSRKGYFWFIHWQIEVVLLHQIFDWEPNWLYQILVQRTLIETRMCLVQTLVEDCFFVTYSSAGSVWCYCCLVLLFGASVWCFCLVLLFGTTVWYYCLVLLFGATVWRWWQIVFWWRTLVPAPFGAWSGLVASKFARGGAVRRRPPPRFLLRSVHPTIHPSVSSSCYVTKRPGVGSNLLWMVKLICPPIRSHKNGVLEVGPIRPITVLLCNKMGLYGVKAVNVKTKLPTNSRV